MYLPLFQLACIIKVIEPVMLLPDTCIEQTYLCIVMNDFGAAIDR